MRCPYCGGLNREQSVFCVNCGRDMRVVPPHQQQPQPTGRPVVNAPNSATQRGYPSQPTQPPRANPPVPARPTSQPAPAAPRRQPVGVRAPEPIIPVAPPAPEAPGPFPPRTMSQFEALIPTGAQAYTVIASSINNGKRKVIRIAYPACTHWQQAATLFKALKEQQDAQCNVIIIQGVLPQQPETYDFNNGQLQFERDARLGAQVSNRYVVETANGYEFGAVRFVLNE